MMRLRLSIEEITHFVVFLHLLPMLLKQSQIFVNLLLALWLRKKTNQNVCYSLSIYYELFPQVQQGLSLYLGAIHPPVHHIYKFSSIFSLDQVEFDHLFILNEQKGTFTTNLWKQSSTNSTITLLFSSAVLSSLLMKYRVDFRSSRMYFSTTEKGFG